MLLSAESIISQMISQFFEIHNTYVLTNLFSLLLQGVKSRATIANDAMLTYFKHSYL